MYSSIVLLKSGDKNVDPIFALYPNPVQNGILTIRTNKPDWAGSILQVYSLSGHLLKEVIMSDFSLQLSVSDLHPGLYLFRGSWENKKMYAKIVVENIK